MLSLGLVGIHDAGVTLSEMKFFKKAIDQDKFPIRNYAMILCSNPNEYCGDEFKDKSNYKDKLFVKSVKLFMDGALGSWGALLKQPYTDNPHTSGILRLNQTNLSNLYHQV